MSFLGAYLGKSQRLTSDIRERVGNSLQANSALAEKIRGTGWTLETLRGNKSGQNFDAKPSQSGTRLSSCRKSQCNESSEPRRIKTGSYRSSPLSKNDQRPPAGSPSCRNATLCTPVISKRLRQRMFLHIIMSSRRSIYDCALANFARSRSSARGGRFFFFIRTSHWISYSADWWQWGQLKFAGFLSERSSKNSRSSIGIWPLAAGNAARGSPSPSNSCERANSRRQLAPTLRLLHFWGSNVRRCGHPDHAAQEQEKSFFRRQDRPRNGPRTGGKSKTLPTCSR